MKNKLFLPIVLVCIVIIIESILLLVGSKAKTTSTPVVTNTISTEVVKNENVVDFEWVNEDGKTKLIMKANKAVAIDAIDLYISYKNAKVNAVNNLNDLPKPTFSKISADKSLVVMNYLISEAEGFKIKAGQSINIAELEIISDSTEAIELTVAEKTQVVENGTAKVLPFSSKNLIINSSL